MDVYPKTFMLLIVEANGGILYSNLASPDATVIDSIKSVENLNFTPNLLELLRTYQSYASRDKYIKSSFTTLNNSDGNRYKLEIKQIDNESSKFYLLKLLPEFEEDRITPELNEFLKSADENNLFLILTDDSGLIEFCSKFARCIFQKDADLIKGRKIFDVVQPYLPLPEREKIKNALRSGKYWQKDLMIKNESDNYLRLTLIPIRDSYNNLKNFILEGIDVTKLMKEISAYEKVTRLTKAITDNIPGLFAVLKEKSGKIILGEANNNFFKTFNLHKRIVINQDIRTIFSSDFLKLLLNLIKKTNAEKSVYFDYSFVGNATAYFAGKIIKLTEINEESAFYIILMRDISDISNYKKQLKKSYNRENYLNKLKSSFLINMAMEIRTPYNSIMAYSDLIEEYLQEKDYTSVRELLNSTKDVLRRVSNLFDNVTTLSQLESGNVDIKKVKLDCNEVLRLAFLKIKQDVEQKKLEFELKLYPEELVIEADWVKIERIIFLLLDNAIKYSSKGKIILESNKNNGYAEIRIIDFGKGISKKNLEQLPEPFNIRDDDAGISEGAGLGLSIASGYTKLMGGHFKIESKTNKGTKITLSFPLVN